MDFTKVSNDDKSLDLVVSLDFTTYFIKFNCKIVVSMINMAGDMFNNDVSAKDINSLLIDIDGR